MKNIYITWHYTTHGVAYLKHILSRFYLFEKLPSEELNLRDLDQEELNLVFDNPKQNGFVFDEVIYLTAPQTAFDKLSSRRFSYKRTILEDEFVIKNNLQKLFEEIISDDKICYDLEAELSYVKEKYPEKLELFEQAIWRNIQHYSIEMQEKWLTKYSNFKKVYEGRFKSVKLNVDDLRNEQQIADEVSKWSRRYFSNSEDLQPIINVSLGSNETQVVWHILAEEGLLPDNTRFIKTYDDKSDTPERKFKRFAIQEIPTNLISAIGAGFKLYPQTKSPSRELVNKKMEIFLKSGFSILLIGERGIGKSRIASDAKKDNKMPFIEANCASFEEDSKAESDLFGHEKGAFTDARYEKKGLLEEANGGILFLDEVHHLSKRVQAKLMKAIQTDRNNKMSIRRMGSNKEIKVECRLIFATNKSIKELQEILLPDFYDRIVQHVIHIPPLRDTPEDRITDWEKVWKELKFGDKVPKEKELLKWLEKLPLYGNYRDLQKIAMYYKAFNDFDEETKKMLAEKSAFEYAKNEFEKYHSPNTISENEKFNFNTQQTTKEMIADYLYELQDWAVKKFKGRKKAIEHFRKLGDTVTEKTFNNWKKKNQKK
ncbi:MAG: sigma-54 factor interaction domain-containing protein [Raineya sp.]|nr:sigma-54 factor interaction domain-containing protein [Raineya sp.]